MASLDIIIDATRYYVIFAAFADAMLDAASLIFFH